MASPGGSNWYLNGCDDSLKDGQHEDLNGQEIC